MESTERRKAWFDPRLELRASNIEGIGVFANAFIAAGELLAVEGEGIVYTSDDFKSGRVQLDGDEYNETQLDDDLFMATPKSEDMAYYFAHSCDPNMWLDRARRDIQPDEEITTDYALCIADPAYRLEPCLCGSALCRHSITGNDWQIPALQQRYQGHFDPYITRKIAAMKKEDVLPR
jgi:uncharacterized protein